MKAQILDGCSHGPWTGQRQKWPWSIVGVFRKWIKVIGSWKKTGKGEMLVAHGIKLKEWKRNHLEVTSNPCYSPWSPTSPLALLWFSKWLQIEEITYLVCFEISYLQWWIFVQTLFFRTHFWYGFILPFLERSYMHYSVGKHGLRLNMYSFKKFFSPMTNETDHEIFSTKKHCFIYLLWIMWFSLDAFPFWAAGIEGFKFNVENVLPSWYLKP